MNLETLRERIAAQYIEVEAGGEKWRIGKLTAQDSMALSPVLAGKDEVAFSIEVVSRSIRDAEGKRPFDSSEGRELLSQLGRDVFMPLHEAAMDFSYPDTAKKKSPDGSLP